MRMHVQLSHYADGVAWPETEASVGRALLGPEGFLTSLEMRSGWQVPVPGPAVRVGQYMKMLRQGDNGARFYSRSLSADPWETARELLGWRDSLVLAGWRGQRVVEGSRTEVLANVEEGARTGLGPGFADRMRAVIRTVDDVPEFTLDWLAAVRLLEPREDWEPWWEELFQALEARGIGIEEAGRSTGAALGDLGMAQAVLAGQIPRAAYQGDGSLSLVEADNEAELAEVLAAWLQAERQQTAVVVAEQHSELLDRTLKSAGLPGVGVTSSSAHRTVLQVLPGAWETFWGPPSVEAYLHWLGLTISPIPRGLRRRLSHAMIDTPGIGGARWHEALQDARAQAVHDMAQHYPASEHSQRQREWDEGAAFWFAHPHYDPHSGLPKSLALAITGRVVFRQ